jgi:hypothetical protein
LHLSNLLELARILRALLDGAICIAIIPQPLDAGLVIAFFVGTGLGYCAMTRSRQRIRLWNSISTSIELGFVMALIPKIIGCPSCYQSVRVSGQFVTFDIAFVALFVVSLILVFALRRHSEQA